MGLGSGMAVADRFAAYVGELTKVIGHADREGPLRDYCSGLLAAEGRRSVEPMAAVTAPAHVSAQHQKLLHFVANRANGSRRGAAGPFAITMRNSTSIVGQGIRSRNIST